MPVISTVRRDRAKKVAVVSCAGLVVSLIVYYLGHSDAGILCAVVSSAIPSIVNLVND